MTFQPWQSLHRRSLAEGGEHGFSPDIQSSIKTTPSIYLRLAEDAEQESIKRSKAVRVGAIFASLMVGLGAFSFWSPDEAQAADPSLAAGSAGDDDWDDDWDD